MDPLYRELVVPESVKWSTDQVPSLGAAADHSWPPGLETDRILTRNYGYRVVVCMPTLDLPHIVRSAPILTDLQATVDRPDIDQVEELIDSARTHLEPDGSAFFYSGVKYYDVQSLSTTPERFLDELELVHTSDAVEQPNPGPRYPDEATERHLRITAAAVWPVRHGWFYLEGDHLTEADRSRWRYGLLLPEPLVDVQDVMPFFDAVTDDPPRYQRQWPYRTLVVDASANRPALTHTDEISETVPVLPIHGTNPLYGTAIETLVADADPIPSALSNPLQATSSFLYEVEGRLLPEADLRLQQVVAVEPPTPQTLFVAAKARFHRDQSNNLEPVPDDAEVADPQFEQPEE